MLSHMTTKNSSPIRLLVFFLACVSIISCQSYEPSSFRDSQITPSSACWLVNISDGIDTDSSGEFEALFDCFNQTGTFEELEPLVEHWIGTGSGFPPLYSHISEAFNNLGSLDIKLTSIINTAYTLIDEHPDLLKDLESIAVELVYAHPRNLPPDSLDSQQAIDAGVIKPLFQMGQQLSTVALSNPSWIEETLTWQLSDTSKDLVCTIETLEPIISEEHPTIDEQILNFISAPLNTDNDRWIGEADDSLENWLLETTANDAQFIYDLEPTIHSLLSDTRVQTELLDLLEDQLLTDNLQSLPEGLHYLLSVDKDGGILNDNEKSAFFHIMRLMTTTNQPLECSIDIFGVPISQIEIDNLAVQLLTRLSESSDANLSGALDLLYVLDLGIAQFTLDTIINSNVCPLLSQEVLDDIAALERLNDAPSEGLFEVGLDAIRRLKHNDTAQNKLYEVADIISIIHSHNITEPTEELLRDVLPTQFIDTIIQLIPSLLTPPTSVDSCPEASQFLTFEDLFNILSDLTESSNQDLETILLPAQELIRNEALWNLRLKVILYLETDNLVLIKPLELLSRYQQFDPQLSIISTVGDIYTNDAVRTAGLLVLSDSNTQSIITSSNEEAPGPVSLIGTWIYTDTLSDIIELVEWILDPLLSE